ncbi:hypothetical protein CAP35_04425 [Chitinophagaceae bacterium IBVUCB1]|nr:hypothetical protein CAP35_04425 [Chitinophagaceae bacterium IBVUCB1]
MLLVSAAHAQTVREVATLITTPRKVVSLPVDYYVLQAAEGEQEAFDKTFRRLTPADVIATQNEKQKERNKVRVLQCDPCVLPYAQLDTLANIKFKRNMQGYWRAVAIRTLRFTDSIDNKAELFNRAPQLIAEDTVADMLMNITEDDCRVYYKEAGKEKFRVITDSKYELKNKRCLLMYKNMKSAGSVSFAGIDSAGRLLLYTSTATQRRIPNKYNVYETITSQVILEKLNVAQLNYKEEKNNKPIPSRRVSPN